MSATFDDPIEKFVSRNILIIDRNSDTVGRLTRFIANLRGNLVSGEFRDAAVGTLEQAADYLKSNEPNIVLVNPEVSATEKVLDFVEHHRTASPRIVWVVLSDRDWWRRNNDALGAHNFGERFEKYYRLDTGVSEETAFRRFLITLTLCHSDFVLELLKNAAVDAQWSMTPDQTRKFVEKGITPLLPLLVDTDESPGTSSQKAFVSMEFSPAQIALYDTVIRPALQEAGYSPMMMAQERLKGSIPVEIFAHIAQCGVFVADLTRLRPDVLIEIGAALILTNIPRILIRDHALRDEDLPFLVRSYQILRYSSPDDLRTHLRRELSQLQ